jgi:hypothetical protein
MHVHRYAAWKRVPIVGQPDIPARVLELCRQADSVRGLSVYDIAEQLNRSSFVQIEQSVAALLNAGLLWQVNREVQTHAL